MKQQLKLAGLAALFGIAANAAVAQEKLKIGVILTLSGPAAALGQQVARRLHARGQGPRRQDGRPGCRSRGGR